MPVDTPAWVRDAVFYQIFPDRFAQSARVPKPGPLEPWDSPPNLHGFKGGDLLGVAEHLDYIADLGATAIYLTPIFQSASNHRYHTYDYYTVDPLLGGNAALRELLDRAHGRGMRVILDGVFNHTGRGFWPFHHVLELGASSPYRHWFHFDQEALDRGSPIDAYPAARARHGLGMSEPPLEHPDGGSGGSFSRLGYQAWWDMAALPKLNTDEPAVREYLWSVAEHWLRFGIDGWRLDVPGEINDPPFWAEFRRRCRAVNPEAYLVGEMWDVAPDWLAGDRFDAQMNYPLAEAIIGFVAGESLNEPLLRLHHEYGRIGRLDGAAFGGRLVGLLGAYDPAVTAVQLNLLDSHDTPRLLSILGGDRAAMQLAILAQATLPGAPCVYYGDEIGLEGGIDPDCRRSMPWDEARWDGDLRAFVRAALGLRHAEPLLRHGDLTVVATEGRAIAFQRRAGHEPPPGHRGDRLVIALNPGSEPARLVLDRGATQGSIAQVLPLPGWAVGEPIVTDEAGDLVGWIAPRSGVVARLA
jgi:cyclomaltodextrinase